MVNRLRLSPLAALDHPRFTGGAHPIAVASFGALTVLLVLMVGVQFLGDRQGGIPRLTLSYEATDLEDLVGLAQGAVRVPQVLDEQHHGEEMEVATVNTSHHSDPLPGEEEAEVIRIEHMDAAPRRNTPAPTGGLRRAPIASIQGEGTHGPVPVIGPGGERASDLYARPYQGTAGRPRVALLIGGLGLNSEATQAAIENLPPEVTLSFVPYANNLQHWVDEARSHGHEVLLDLPMEPYDYPDNDPGPATLLTSNEWHENESRLEWVMSRASGFIGVMNYQGARLTADEAAFRPVLENLNSHGLLYLDDGTSQRSLTTRLGPSTQSEWAVANRRIDLRPARTNIDAALLDLEASAVANHVAIGVGFAYPVTVEQIVGWADTLEAKGLSLAPLSATITAEPGPSQSSSQPSGRSTHGPRAEPAHQPVSSPAHH